MLNSEHVDRDPKTGNEAKKRMNTYIATTDIFRGKWQMSSGVYVVNHNTKARARKILEKHLKENGMEDEKITTMDRLPLKEGIWYDQSPVIE